MEVNNHSLAPRRHKTVAEDNNLEILRLCKKYEVPTILGSDAHISFQIADYERLYPLLAISGDSESVIILYLQFLADIEIIMKTIIVLIDNTHATIG